MVGQMMRPLDGGRRLLPSLAYTSRRDGYKDGYNICPAQTTVQSSMASKLVRRMYAWRGYDTDSIGYQEEDPNRVTLAAWRAGEVVATLTLGRDSPAGLLADALYSSELDSLRHPDRVFCEVSRLAVAPDYSVPGLLTTLFHAALRYGKEVFAASDAVMEVNPRHARYYQSRMGFKQIGALRQCERVAAPAVLLHQTLGGIIIA